MWLLKKIWDDIDFGIVDERNDLVENILWTAVAVAISIFVMIVVAVILSAPFIFLSGWATLPFLLIWLALVPLIFWIVASVIKSLCTAFCTIRDQIAKEKAGIEGRSQSATDDIFSVWYGLPSPIWGIGENSASQPAHAPSDQEPENCAGQNRQTRRSRVPTRPRRHRGKASTRFRNAGRMRQSPRSR